MVVQGVEGVEMSDPAFGFCIFVGAIIVVATFLARLCDTDDATGSVAAGVLWPIYLPYRLLLIMWSRLP